ncbi:MAG TPA: hypothetical protein VFB55_02785 [Verrucomicrobiae bacterium]|nr:hypothetical protein [Verrucomicrobiae bacterium]
MDASRRGALMLVRFAAASLMVVALMELALAWAEFYFQHESFNVLLAVFWSLLFVAGVIVLIKAQSLAEWIANKLE